MTTHLSCRLLRSMLPATRLVFRFAPARRTACSPIRWVVPRPEASRCKPVTGRTVTVQVHSCTDALTDVSPRYLVKPVPVQVHSCTDALTDVFPRYLVIISRFVFVTCIAGAQKEPSASSWSTKTRGHLLGSRLFGPHCALAIGDGK